MNVKEFAWITVLVQLIQMAVIVQHGMVIFWICNNQRIQIRLAPSEMKKGARKICHSSFLYAPFPQPYKEQFDTVFQHIHLNILISAISSKSISLFPWCWLSAPWDEVSLIMDLTVLKHGAGRKWSLGIIAGVAALASFLIGICLWQLLRRKRTKQEIITVENTHHSD